MIEPLVPKNFKAPNLVKPDYFARQLTIKDVQADYDAVMSSIDIICQTRGGNWPTTDLTYEDDLADLGWHQREHDFKTNFCYAIYTPDGKEYIGSIYFYAPGTPMSDAKSVEGVDVNISWWITKRKYEEGLYDKLSLDIKDWVETSWPFEKVFYVNKQLPTGF